MQLRRRLSASGYSIPVPSSALDHVYLCIPWYSGAINSFRIAWKLLFSRIVNTSGFFFFKHTSVRFHEFTTLAIQLCFGAIKDTQARHEDVCCGFHGSCTFHVPGGTGLHCLCCVAFICPPPNRMFLFVTLEFHTMHPDHTFPITPKYTQPPLCHLPPENLQRPICVTRLLVGSWSIS